MFPPEHILQCIAYTGHEVKGSEVYYNDDDSGLQLDFVAVNHVNVQSKSLDFQDPSVYT